MVDFDLRKGVRRWVWPGSERWFTSPYAGSSPSSTGADQARAGDADPGYAQRLRELAGDDTLDGVAVQSVLVAALRSLQRVQVSERAVAAAAISMGQQSMLAEMTATLAEVIAVLRTMLSEQGAAMLRLPTADASAPEAGEVSWWFALTESLQEIERAQTCLTSLAAGQPKGGAARQIGHVVIRLLRNHHHALFSEAEQWMA